MGSSQPPVRRPLTQSEASASLRVFDGRITSDALSPSGR